MTRHEARKESNMVSEQGIVSGLKALKILQKICGQLLKIVHVKDWSCKFYMCTNRKYFELDLLTILLDIYVYIIMHDTKLMSSQNLH